MVILLNNHAGILYALIFYLKDWKLKKIWTSFSFIWNVFFLSPPVSLWSQKLYIWLYLLWSSNIEPILDLIFVVEATHSCACGLLLACSIRIIPGAPILTQCLAKGLLIWQLVLPIRMNQRTAADYHWQLARLCPSNDKKSVCVVVKPRWLTQGKTSLRPRRGTPWGFTTYFNSSLWKLRSTVSLPSLLSNWVLLAQQVSWFVSAAETVLLNIGSYLRYNNKLVSIVVSNLSLNIIL